MTDSAIKKCLLSAEDDKNYRTNFFRLETILALGSLHKCHYASIAKACG